MKKTLVAALISSVILLTGCQDKDTEAKNKTTKSNSSTT